MMTRAAIVRRNVRIAETKTAKRERRELKAQRVSVSLLRLFDERRKARARKSRKVRRWHRLHAMGLA